MKLELTVCELGEVLKTIENKYDLEIMTKIKLSGGWMTLSGKAVIEHIPVKGIILGCNNKSNNIISIRVKNHNEEGSLIKITGTKGLKFSIDIEASKYKELGKFGSSEIKINNNECKLRIDEDIMFKINSNVESVLNIIEKL